MTHSTAHKTQLQTYFNGIGFDRWAAIYGEGDLSFVRRSIREGHSRMLATASQWMQESLPPGKHLLDVGCGTGLFTVSMAQAGYHMTAVDIAPRMVEATQAAATDAGLGKKVATQVSDAESVSGSYDGVVCFDVLVHYPAEAFVSLCTHLARRSTGPFLFTYAPYNRFLAGLHWLGGKFPQGQRRTEIQMIPEKQVLRALADAGMAPKRTASISQGFYHVTLMEAVPV